MEEKESKYGDCYINLEYNDPKNPYYKFAMVTLIHTGDNRAKKAVLGINHDTDLFLLSSTRNGGEAPELPCDIEYIVGGAFEDETGFSSITMPSKLTRIGKSAFEGSSVKMVDFDNCDNLTTIGDCAFSGSKLGERDALNSHIKAELDLSCCKNLILIGTDAFRGTNIEVVKLPKEKNHMIICSHAFTKMEIGGRPQIIYTDPAEKKEK